MKFFKQLKKLKLTKAEKEKSLDFLLARTGLVRNSSDYRHLKQRVTFLHLFTNHKYMLVGLLIAAILAMGGGTAVAAENTLPGDLLYSIKTHVNEEVRAALTTSGGAKVAWETERAQRRLQEAEKLSSEGKLTTSTSAMLASKFEEFSKKADERLQKLQDAGKLTEEQVQKLKENFEVAIKAHDEVLSRIQEKELERGKLKVLVDSLREQASSTIKDRLEHEWELLKNNTSTTLKNVAENRKNAAQNKIAEVEKFITNNAEKVSIENKTEATNKLAEAKTLITEGGALFTQEKYGEAVVKYTEAHRKAQEAQMYMTTRFHLERKLNISTSTTSTVFVSGTLQFNNEKRQQVWDQHESLKNLEQNLREEVKQAKEDVREIKKQEMEKVREEVKNKRELDRELEKSENDDRKINISTSATSTI